MQFQLLLQACTPLSPPVLVQCPCLVMFRSPVSMHRYQQRDPTSSHPRMSPAEESLRCSANGDLYGNECARRHPAAYRAITDDQARTLDENDGDCGVCASVATISRTARALVRVPFRLPRNLIPVPRPWPCATCWSLCVLHYEVLPLSSVMFLYFTVTLAELSVAHS